MKGGGYTIMGLFTCKHKSYMVISCDEKSRNYTCRCIKCDMQFTLPKAIGETYAIGSVIKNKQKRGN